MLSFVGSDTVFPVQIYKYGVNGSSVDFFHFARDLAA